MIWSLIFFCLTLVSCSQFPDEVIRSLELADDNRVELEKVLDHYKGDHLKYQAAEYLIRNMPFYGYNEVLPEFEPVFDSMALIPVGDYEFRKNKYIRFFESVTGKGETRPGILKYDIREVTAGFLIENIDLAFEAWQEIPEDKRASFEEFCDYILPYRNWDEPLEAGSRAYLQGKYGWVPKLLKHGTPAKTVIDSVLQGFWYRYVEEVRDYYPSALSVLQFDRSRQGLCQDAVTYFTHVFRSVGIVCSNEYLPQWGTHHNRGHSWLYIRYGEEEFALDASADGKDVRQKYIGESVPKAFRRTYAQDDPTSLFREGRDVTTFYRPVIDFEMKVETSYPDTSATYTVNVYHGSKGWAPVAEMEWEKSTSEYPSTLICHDLGVSTLYIAGRYDQGEVTPVSLPFFVSEEGEIEVFRPNTGRPDTATPSTGRLDSVPLLRKYGLSSPKSRRKAIWIRNLEGAAIIAAQDTTFADADTLYRFRNYWSTHRQTVDLRSPGTYRCVRFVPEGDTVHLAELAFYDAEGNILEGEIISHNVEPGLTDSAVFDGNPLTYSGGIDFDVGYQFAHPVRIHSIAFQARNDDNHIRVGDEYELQYWDREWKSLGNQVARDTVLYYHDVPRNALLILRNHTRGSEEIPFRINADIEQEWMGFDNY